MLRQELDLPRIWDLLSCGPSHLLSTCSIQGPELLPSFPSYSLRLRWKLPDRTFQPQIRCQIGQEWPGDHYLVSLGPKGVVCVHNLQTRPWLPLTLAGSQSDFLHLVSAWSSRQQLGFPSLRRLEVAVDPRGREVY